MKRIRVEEIVNWKIAKKTKNIKAKPLISIMIDKSVLNKFLVELDSFVTEKLITKDGLLRLQVTLSNGQVIYDSLSDINSYYNFYNNKISENCFNSNSFINALSNSNGLCFEERTNKILYDGHKHGYFPVREYCLVNRIGPSQEYSLGCFILSFNKKL